MSKYWLTLDQLKELSQSENGNQIYVLCHKIAKEQKLETARKESLSKGLAQTLKDFYEYAGHKEVKLQDVPLTKNQFTNFQKLQYHGLVNNTMPGYWDITELGTYFLSGAPVSKSVTIDNGQVIEKSSEKTTIDKLLKSTPQHHFAQRYDYLG